LSRHLRNRSSNDGAASELEGFSEAVSLVTCPVALFPATSETEKVSFNQINRKTGHRIKYTKVDAESGEDVASEDIIKGYKVDTDTYVTVDKDELDNIALESTRTIDIDEFVPRLEVDELYLVRPYYIVPEGKVGHGAYAVIPETIRTMDKVAIARVVLTNREHIIALEARGKGLVGMLLRYPYENEYFDEIQDVKITKEMLDLARHIVETKSADFEPGKFEDRYENALVELSNRKRAGKPLRTAVKPRDTGNVINLMDALRKSLSDGSKTPATSAKAKQGKKSANGTGQREMLIAIPGKGEGKTKTAAKETKRTIRHRKAG
jgi:DNA end-binding protein Ku